MCATVVKIKNNTEIVFTGYPTKCRQTRLKPLSFILVRITFTLENALSYFAVQMVK